MTGRFPDLRSVIDHYDSHLRTGLSDDEKTAPDGRERVSQKQLHPEGP